MKVITDIYYSYCNFLVLCWFQLFFNLTVWNHFLREIYSPFLPSYPSVVAFLFSLIQRPERLYFSLLAFTSSPRRDIKRCT